MKNLLKILLLFTVFSCSRERIIFDQTLENHELTSDHSNMNNLSLQNLDQYENTLDISQRESNALKNVLNEYFSIPKNQRKLLNRGLGKQDVERGQYKLFENEDVFGVIPIYMESEDKISGLLFSYLKGQDQLKFKIYTREKIINLKRKKDNKGKLHLELGLGMLLYLESNIFGYTDCELIKKLRKSYNQTPKTAGYRDYCVMVIVEEGNCSHYYEEYSDGDVYIGTACETQEYYEEVCYEEDGANTPAGDGEDSENGGGGSTSSHYIDNIPYDIIEILEIGDNEDFECLYNKFIEGNNSLFCNTIGAFYDAQDFTLYFDENKNSPDINCRYVDGCTDDDRINENILTIYLDPNMSPLEMAGTILHEGVHAALKVFLKNKGLNVKVLNKEQLIYYNAYYNGNSVAEHYHMSNTYVHPIAQALREIDNYKNPLEHYFSIAWQGLDVYSQNQADKNEANYYLNENSYLDELNASSTLCKK